jgi:hypothetical protein
MTTPPLPIPGSTNTEPQPLSIERYARMRAEMETGRLRDDVLAVAGITADEWMVAQRQWLELDLYPDAAERIFRRYGLADPEKRIAAGMGWRERLRRDAFSYAMWKDMVRIYHEHWLAQGAPPSSRRPSPAPDRGDDRGRGAVRDPRPR